MQLFNFVSLLTFLLISSTACAVDSTELSSRQDFTAMILCPQMTMNGVILNATPQTVSYGPVTDCIDLTGGHIGWAIRVVGVHFVPACPPDHPYMGSIREVWGGDLYGGGGTMSVTCCTTPNPQKAATAVWVPGPTCP